MHICRTFEAIAPHPPKKKKQKENKRTFLLMVPHLSFDSPLAVPCPGAPHKQSKAMHIINADSWERRRSHITPNLPVLPSTTQDSETWRNQKHRGGQGREWGTLREIDLTILTSLNKFTPREIHWG